MRYVLALIGGFLGDSTVTAIGNHYAPHASLVVVILCLLSGTFVGAGFGYIWGATIEN